MRTQGLDHSSDTLEGRARQTAGEIADVFKKRFKDFLLKEITVSGPDLGARFRFCGGDNTRPDHRFC